MSTRPELSYDGKGINGPDEYRTRIATFTGAHGAADYGPLFAAAPELLAMVEALDAYLRDIRAENLDGSEPALGELLDDSLALRERLA
jgi:hypothetical protein